MGIFRSAGEKRAKKWASPDCERCHGTGRVQGAGNWMENCGCVLQNQMEAQKPQSRPQQDLTGLHAQLAWLDKDREEWAARQPPEMMEMRKLITNVDHKATRETKQRMKAGELFWCCMAAECICTLNYRGGPYFHPSPDESTLAQWKTWNQWLEQQRNNSVTALPR